MSETVLLTGWGRTAPTMARVHAVAQDVARAGDAAEAVAELVGGAGDRGVLARGLGRSYGDAAQNAGGAVVLQPAEGRLDVDVERAEVEVGAGVSLDRLIRELLPHGLFVPVTPGTRFVTVGGAIACDIHGKNHHVDGTFGRHVIWLDLVDAEGRRRRLAPEESPDLFWATVGGMGLTGVVVAARLRLRRVETSVIRVDTDRAANLGELLTLMRQGDAGYTYSVAWIDLLSRGRSLGRSVLTRGEHATTAQLPAGRRADPLAFDARQRLSVPPWVPGGLVNKWSVRAFNEMWFRKAPRRRRGQLESLGGFFHPLDGVGEWNRLYGRRGLTQYQFVVPLDQEDALAEAVDRIAAAGQASFLAVLKRFGPANPAPLSFPDEGWTLALDLPADPRLAPLFNGLDELVVAAGGRVYLAKDARLSRETLHRMYPRLPQFEAVRDEVDPQRVFRSDLARRLGL